MKKRPVGKLILVNLSVFLVLLLILEIIFRMNGYETFSSKKPDVIVEPNRPFFQKYSLLGIKNNVGEFQITLKKDFSFKVTHDSSNLRVTSSETSVETLPKPEIWIMGCSFTYGWSINDYETFPWLLQSAIPNYKIVNGGTNAYGTLHFYLQLKEALKKKNKPEIVILNHADFHVFRNTLDPTWKRILSEWNFLGTINLPGRKLDTKGSPSIFYSKLNNYTLAKYSAFINHYQKQIETYLESKNKENGDGDGIEITNLILTKIVDLCNEHQIKFILTNISGDIRPLYNYGRYKNVRVLDLRVDLRREEYNNMPYDNHPSTKANVIYAQRIHSYLKKVLIEKTRKVDGLVCK